MRFHHIIVATCVVLGVALWGYIFGTTGPPMRGYFSASASMVPSLLAGERVFASSGYCRRHAPVPGDIVIFVIGDKPPFVKRVVVGPGDRVKMEQGRLVIDGEMLARSPLAHFALQDGQPPVPHYLETLANGRSYEILETQGDLGLLDTTEEVTLEPGQYFLLGDNRDASMDSRVEKIGAVALEQIHSRPTIVWFSTDWRRLGKQVQPAE